MGGGIHVQSVFNQHSKEYTGAFMNKKEIYREGSLENHDRGEHVGVFPKSIWWLERKQTRLMDCNSCPATMRGIQEITFFVCLVGNAISMIRIPICEL